MTTAAEEARVLLTAALCPHTDCPHESTYSCSGWAYAVDALAALKTNPDLLARLTAEAAVARRNGT